MKHFYVHIIPSAGLHISGVEIKSPLEVVKADNTLIEAVQFNTAFITRIVEITWRLQNN